MISILQILAGALILLEEGDSENSRAENRQSYEDQLCAPLSVCLPISSCPLLNDLLDKSCLASDKLTALTCGWGGGEARVCCPPGGQASMNTPFSFNDGLQRPMGDDGYAIQQDIPLQGAASQTTSQSGVPSCGKPMVQARNYSGIGSHPWVARIGFKHKYNGQMRHPCGGSIVSRRVILTAAHCALAKAEEFKLSSVTVGEWNTQTDPDCGEMFCAGPVQIIPISQVIVHPGYDKKIYRHDVALVVLKQDIKYTVTSLPICLSGAPLPLTGGLRGIVPGWGRLGSQRVAPSILQPASAIVLPLEECAKLYSAAAPLSNAQMCARAEPPGDACAGYGGAPLVMIIDGRYTQVGIVSFGSEKCGSTGVPSVYTNVHSYSNWIRDNSPPS